MGTLSIQWDKIRHLISKDIFEVDLQDGRIFFGKLDTTYSVRQMKVKGKDQTKIHFKTYVVTIIPIKDTFWDILDGKYDYAYLHPKVKRRSKKKIGLKITLFTCEI